MKVYLAGPLFTAAERTWNEMIAWHLESAGLEVFLPQRDAEIAARHIRKEENLSWATVTALADIAGLESCDVVLACLDGPDPDSGTAWEMGYADALDLPVYWYRTDFRSRGDGDEVNNMLCGTATKVELAKVLPEYEVEALDVAGAFLRLVDEDNENTL